MTNKEKLIALRVLQEIVEALLEGAAGPCGYWYRKLAERLVERAGKITKEVES
jgi:hypothetical protein